jgi:hypothetical protein
MSERRKLEYLIGRIVADRDEIFDALDGPFFNCAEVVLHSFIENASDGFEDEEVEVFDVGSDPIELLKSRYSIFLRQWRPDDDTPRN